MQVQTEPLMVLRRQTVWYLCTVAVSHPEYSLPDYERLVEINL